MALQNIPVVGLTLFFSSMSSSWALDRYFFRGAPVVAANTATWADAILSSIPIGPLSTTSLLDYFLCAQIIWRSRHLERQWGSAAYLSFLITAAVMGGGAARLLVSDGGPTSAIVFSAIAVRVLSAVGSIPALTALTVRQMMDLPTDPSVQPPTRHLHRLLQLVPLVKIALFPQQELRAPTHRRPAILLEVGLKQRLLLLILGIIFAITSARSRVVRLWLRTFATCVCRPFLRRLQPIISFVFGPTHRTEHFVPITPGTEEGGSPTATTAPVVMEGGRVVVDSLSGGGASSVRGGGQARRAPTAFAPAAAGLRQRHGAPHADVLRTAAAAFGEDDVAGPDAGVARILELGLHVSAEEAHEALRACGGDVNAAVHRLMGQH